MSDPLTLPSPSRLHSTFGLAAETLGSWHSCLLLAWSSERLKQGWSSRHRVVASYMYIVLIARSFVHLFVQHVLVFVFPWISLIICLSWSIKTTSFCSFFEGLAWLKMWIYILLLYPHILRMTSYQPCEEVAKTTWPARNLVQRQSEQVKTRFEVLTCRSFLVLILKHSLLH